MASCFRWIAESIFVDLAPRDADACIAADPAREPPDPARARPPVAGPDQQRNDARRLPGAALDREVVDVAAPAAVLVEQLVVEHVQSDVELVAAQFCPAFVRIISGIADTATTTITTR